jgi:hypothetical protein
VDITAAPVAILLVSPHSTLGRAAAGTIVTMTVAREFAPLIAFYKVIALFKTEFYRTAEFGHTTLGRRVILLGLVRVRVDWLRNCHKVVKRFGVDRL